MIFYSNVPMSENSKNLFLPDYFPVNFSDEEKSMMWTWESGHNLLPVTPLSSDINELFSGKGIIDANNYFGRTNNSQKKIINGYTYYASINNQNTNNEIENSYCENLDIQWKNKFLPEIEKDLNLMKNKINDITELEDGKKIIEELLTINQKHWYIHMLVVIPLHHYADKFFDFIKTFNPSVNLSDLYNLFQGIDNKTLEIDKNLYNLKLIYNSAGQNIKDEKLLSEVDKFNQLYGYRLVGFDLSDQIWINDSSIILNLIKNIPISVFENKISQTNDSDRKFYLKNLVSNVTNKEDENEIYKMYSVLSQIWYLKEDHSFYIDQYSNALISLALLKLGDILVTKGLIEKNSDIFYLSYKSFTDIHQNTSGLMTLISENKKQREHYKNLTPPKYLGNLNKDNYFNWEGKRILEKIARFPRMIQMWKMFSPNVLSKDNIIIIEAFLENGQSIDPFTGKPPVLNSTDYSILMTNNSQLWRKYFENFRRFDATNKNSGSFTNWIQNPKNNYFEKNLNGQKIKTIKIWKVSQNSPNMLINQDGSFNEIKYPNKEPKVECLSIKKTSKNRNKNNNKKPKFSKEREPAMNLQEYFKRHKTKK